MLSIIECFKTPANDSLHIWEGTWKGAENSPTGRGLPIVAYGLKPPLYSEPRKLQLKMRQAKPRPINLKFGLES